MKIFGACLVGVAILLAMAVPAHPLMCQQFGSTTICDGVMRQEFGSTTIITGEPRRDDQRDGLVPLTIIPPQPASPVGQPQPIGICAKINGITYCY